MQHASSCLKSKIAETASITANAILRIFSQVFNYDTIFLLPPFGIF